MAKHITRLTFLQRTALFEELKKHCTKGEDGLVRYADGWDDARVTAVVGAPVNVTHVRNLRNETLGPVIKRAPKDLEDRLTMIEDFLTSKWPDWQSHLDPDLFGKDGK